MMTNTCARCGRAIYFVPNAWIENNRWVSDPADPKNSWKCGRDPAFPVRTHAPKEPTP